MAYKNHQQFYDDPKLYDEVLAGSDPGELEYYKRLAAAGRNLLFLGPGTGRILKSLSEVNSGVVGVERSKNMAQKSAKNAPEATIINQDILNLKLKEKFDLVIAPYEFLNHFDTEKLNRVLKVVAEHLSAGGRFITQLKNPYHCAGRLHSAELDYVGLSGKDILEKTYVAFDESKQMYTDYIERTSLSKNTQDLVVMTWYYYFPKQLEVYYKKAGLKTGNVMGKFNGAKFTKTSPLLIIEATSA